MADFTKTVFEVSNTPGLALEEQNCWWVMCVYFVVVVVVVGGVVVVGMDVALEKNSS
jgi:hypothetical protein